MDAIIAANDREPWNKGKLVGQKATLKVKDIWAIRVRLQIALAIVRCSTWASIASFAGVAS